MRIRHTDEKSLQGLAKQDLLKGATTCKLEFCEYCVIEKKTKVNSAQRLIAPRRFWIMFTPIFGNLPRYNHYFVTFIDDYSRRCWVYTMKHKGKILELFVE